MLVVLSLRLSEDSTVLQHTTGPLLHWPALDPEPWLGSGPLAGEVLVALSVLVVGVHAGAVVVGQEGAVVLGAAGVVEVGAGQVGEGEGVGVSEGGHGAARTARAERRRAERANLNCMVIVRAVENEGVQGA